MLFHSSFKDVIRDEWNKPDTGKHINQSNLRLCNIQEPKGSIADIPKVDAMKASLTRDTVISSEEEFHPEEPMDRKMEDSLREGFEASSVTLSVLAASFAGASLS